MYKELRETAKRLESDLGLPEGFLEELPKSDDWSFIIRTHALMEASVSFLLIHHFGDDRLGNVFDFMELSDKRRGKIALELMLTNASEDQMTRRQPGQRQAETPEHIALAPKHSRSLTRNQITRLCSEIAREFHPDKIVLFGSHAYGKPRLGSDVDLLVVMPFEGSPFRQAAAILGRVVQTVGIMPLDLLVRTGQQVQERIQMGDSFMREIIERGRVMYEADSEGIMH